VNVTPDLVHVAAAAIVDARGDVLIAQRPAHVHQGGYWEFPGGKVEPGEDARAALGRELHEELGIDIVQARPLIRVAHDYPDKRVLLDVWRVDGFRGEPHGREGQPIAWVAPDALPARAFPAANLPIVTAVRLPDRYLVTGEPVYDRQRFLERLEQALERGVQLVQLRAKGLSEAALCALAQAALAPCRRHGARLLVNADPAVAERSGADGVHLSSARLMALRERPLPKRYWVAASCHDHRELRHASRIGVDFVVAGPVLPTTSHPGSPTLGWGGLRRLTEAAGVPVYALGGMKPEHLEQAWRHGAQGIAAISALW
jgi:8-oxo-dGTP diphosphatase